MTETEPLSVLLRRFVDGRERSREFVGRIEDAVVRELSREQPALDREMLEDLVDLVALYTEHPAHDEKYLYGPDVLRERFLEALKRL